MEFERAERLASQGVRPDDTVNLEPTGNDEVELPNSELFDKLLERVFDAAGHADPLERGPNPHLAVVVVGFRKSSHDLKLDIMADRTGPSPNYDCLSAAWSYRDNEQKPVALINEVIARPAVRNEADTKARNMLRLLGKSVTSLEDSMAEKDSISLAILL